MDFYRDWESYSKGFGDLGGDFWLGNSVLNQLTEASGEHQLRIDITDTKGVSMYAVYDSFSVTNAADNYRLILGAYSGTAGETIFNFNMG